MKLYNSVVQLHKYASLDIQVTEGDFVRCEQLLEGACSGKIFFT